MGNRVAADNIIITSGPREQFSLSHEPRLFWFCCLKDQRLYETITAHGSDYYYLFDTEAGSMFKFSVGKWPSPCIIPSYPVRIRSELPSRAPS